MRDNYRDLIRQIYFHLHVRHISLQHTILTEDLRLFNQNLFYLFPLVLGKVGKINRGQPLSEVTWTSPVISLNSLRIQGTNLNLV